MCVLSPFSAGVEITPPPQRKIIAILVEGRKRCFERSERHTEKQSSRSAVPPTAISLNRVVGSSSSAPGRAEPRIPSIAPTATFRSSPQTERCVSFPTGRLQLPHACTQLLTLRPPPVSATAKGGRMDIDERLERKWERMGVGPKDSKELFSIHKAVMRKPPLLLGKKMRQLKKHHSASLPTRNT